MARTVVALFDEAASAQEALEALLSAGVARDDVSVLGPHEPMDDTLQDEAQAEGNRAGAGAGLGAATGAVVGGGAGLLASLGALAIPGLGPLIAAGPILAAIAGAGVGAAAGGLIGGLIGMGIPIEEVDRYHAALERGATLVLVQSRDARSAERVAGILEAHGPVDVDRHAERRKRPGGRPAPAPHMEDHQRAAEAAAAWHRETGRPVGAASELESLPPGSDSGPPAVTPVEPDSERATTSRVRVFERRQQHTPPPEPHEADRAETTPRDALPASGAPVGPDDDRVDLGVDERRGHAPPPASPPRRDR